MFNTDKPILKPTEDKLGRGAFAKQLANAIMQFKTKDNYAISLQGKWGCGKTSVLNMAQEEIKTLNESVENDKKILTVQFNPWNFTDTSQLINQFFITLSNAIKVQDKERKFAVVGAAIEKYSCALEYSQYIPVVGSYLKLLPKVTSLLGKSMKDKAMSKQSDITYKKKVVEEALKQIDTRILVVIDDIDRLSNEQIKLIFQLVNTVAGFPNLIYLLSFDKDIVVRALSEVQHCDGEEYLEKIIQVPFDVPQASYVKLHQILEEKLKGLIRLPSGLDFDANRWTNVYKSCISPFITTVRDINRYYNTFSFMYSGVKDEVDFIDMAGICALRVFASNIYEWIRDNKYLLIDGLDKRESSGFNSNKVEEEMLQEFQGVYPKNPQVMLKAVGSLFPKHNNDFILYNTNVTSVELHRAMRIASRKKFDLYFSLSLENIKISRREINNSLMKMQDNELRVYIQELESREILDIYISELKELMTLIPEERIELILSALLFKTGRISDKENQLTVIHPTRITVYLISKLLFRIGDENNRFEIIANMFSNSDFLSFQNLLSLLHIIELTHGRVAVTPKASESKLVDKEHLYELERIFKRRLEFFLTDTNLLDWQELRSASMLWEFVDNTTYYEYIKSLLTNNLNAIKFVTLYIATWTGWSSSDSSISEYGLEDDSYTNYFSKSKFVEIINEARITNDFWMLDMVIIEKAIAFVLLVEHSEGRENMSASEVTEMKMKWLEEQIQMLEHLETTDITSPNKVSS